MKLHTGWFPGRPWMGEAPEHIRARGFAETCLRTLEGLPAAAKLYAEAGFVEAERVTGTQWFQPVTELRLILRP